MTIGIVHPGEMGAAVGAELTSLGHPVVWASVNRSPATRARALDAGLREVSDLAELSATCSNIISICPPAAARGVAEAVASTRFDGVYLDANAIAPRTAREIGAILGAVGARFVDGGIVGGTPPRERPTRIYLSGRDAHEVAGWFTGANFETVVLGDDPGAASAMKVAYAGWTKGSAALLLAVRSLARSEGVEKALLDEWERRGADLEARSERGSRRIYRKAYRYEGEMQQIAAAMETAGLPAGFHAAAAAICSRLIDVDPTPGGSVDDILDSARHLDH